MQGTRSLSNNVIPRKNWKEHIGKEYDTNQCGKAIIIEAISSYNITIKFINTGTNQIVRYDNLVRGKCLDPNAPVVYGIGFMGEGCLNSQNSRKAYNVWTGVLQRCHKTTGQKTKLSYMQCEICKEWHNFQNFGSWFNLNYRPGYQIDKDLLQKDNKIYSPETCCMIPADLNRFLVRRKTERNIAIGVVKHHNKYLSYCDDPFLRKGKYLGCYSTIEEAFQAYKDYKEKLFKLMAEKYKDAISDKVYQALLKYQVEITD